MVIQRKSPSLQGLAFYSARLVSNAVCIFMERKCLRLHGRTYLWIKQICLKAQKHTMCCYSNMPPPDNSQLNYLQISSLRYTGFIFVRRNGKKKKVEKEEEGLVLTRFVSPL